MPPTLQRTSATEGFMGYLAFVPGRGVGIFLVVGRLDIGTSSGMASAANGLLAMLVPCLL